MVIQEEWFVSRLYDSTGFPFGYIEGEVSQVSYVKEADPQSGYIVLGILVGGFGVVSGWVLMGFCGCV